MTIIKCILESGGVLLHENGGIGLEDSVDNVRLESSEGGFTRRWC